jgi:hypothetical protein
MIQPETFWISLGHVLVFWWVTSFYLRLRLENLRLILENRRMKEVILGYQLNQPFITEAADDEDYGSDVLESITG